MFWKVVMIVALPYAQAKDLSVSHRQPQLGAPLYLLPYSARVARGFRRRRNASCMRLDWWYINLFRQSSDWTAGKAADPALIREK